MTFHSDKPWQLSIVALLLGSSVSASEPPTLRGNPFARPPSVVTTPSLSEPRVDGDPTGLELRATLVGLRDRLANVAGKTLRPGDEFQGYTLVQVLEDRAVFARAGKRLTVFVKPELEKDDED